MPRRITMDELRSIPCGERSRGTLIVGPHPHRARVIDADDGATWGVPFYYRGPHGPHGDVHHVSELPNPNDSAFAHFEGVTHVDVED